MDDLFVVVVGLTSEMTIDHENYDVRPNTFHFIVTDFRKYEAIGLMLWKQNYYTGKIRQM
jgi:hypothetical protein